MPPRGRQKRQRALAIVYRSLKELEPYARNARTHTAAQIKKLRTSLSVYGWTNPVLIADNGIIAGHARVTAAIAMANERHAVQGNADPWMAPTVDLSHLTKKERRAYILADNRLAEDAGWDMELLKIEVGALEIGGFDLSLTGFDPDQLLNLSAMGNTGRADPDDAPDPPVIPVSVLGDVWLLGRHRLVCGDCTDADVAETALGADAVVTMLVTSPPYWAKQDYDDMPGIDSAVAFCSRVAETWSGRVRRRIVVNTGTTTENAIDPKGRPGVRIMLDSLWGAAFAAAGWSLRNRRAWVKAGPNPNVAPVGDAVDQSWETLLTFWRAGKNEGGQERVNEAWSTSGYFDGINGVGKNVVGTDHPCPFPVEIPSRFIRLYSKPDDTVAEPFSGSGTTIIAAEMTGRVCYAIEIAPQYVDVAVRRWEAFTGKRATLEADGLTFAETTEARLAEPAAPTEAAMAGLDG